MVSIDCVLMCVGMVLIARGKRGEVVDFEGDVVDVSQALVCFVLGRSLVWCVGARARNVDKQV